MFKIPQLLLRQLYTFGSLESNGGAVSFDLKNRLADATLTSVRRIVINGDEIALQRVTLAFSSGGFAPASELTTTSFPLREVLTVTIEGLELPIGKHEISVGFESQPFGKLQFSVHDSIATERERRAHIPRDGEDDYSDDAIGARRAFAEEYSGTKLEHISQYSFDAHSTQGNCEHFTGVAQIPLGIVGPVRVNGEYADGEFIVPMATTEGTLVASYNRGIKVMNRSGGIKTTVQRDVMQRAPVFVFPSAREARAFRDWVRENHDHIKEAAEATSSVAELQYIDIYLVSKFAYLRFNYGTGDAAGQNMVGRATFAACSWITEHNKTMERFFLESNLATDKKASMVNIMKTRGKRVTAECVVKRDALIEGMRVEPESIAYHWGVGTLGAMLSGANNNGAHSPNAITAIFIATGQDVANVAESSAAICYTELTAEKDLYMSITIPSLIVASYGGGTGLATQRESLAMMDCVGKGKVRKLAEIIGAVVLAGELSLAAAISSLDWVSSHEQYGRNR